MLTELQAVLEEIYFAKRITQLFCFCALDPPVNNGGAKIDNYNVQIKSTNNNDGMYYVNP